MSSSVPAMWTHGKVGTLSDSSKNYEKFRKVALRVPGQRISLHAIQCTCVHSNETENIKHLIFPKVYTKVGFVELNKINLYCAPH